MQDRTRGSLFLRQFPTSLVGGICAFGFALTLGVSPAAARYKFWHRPAHKKIERVSKDPFAGMPQGPLQIYISIDQQKLHLYSDGVHVADTPIATGVPSLPTPLGVFSVIQKQVFHRSNIYSGAPMPFMQRITWSGVAMHEGEGIGHRASHGCIRMPHDFAVRLYHLTKLGVPVVIARSELRPAEFADSRLFAHKDAPPQPAAAPPAATTDLAPAAPAAADAANLDALGLRVTTANGDTASNTEADSANADSAANDTAKDAGAAKSAPAVIEAPKSAVPAVALTSAPAPSDRKTDAPTPVAAAVAVSSANVRMPSIEPAELVIRTPAGKGPISIFISRKAKKIYVRQDFAPLFEAPVIIADPDQPFGTHVFTALDFAGNDHTTLRWNVVSLPAEPVLRRKVERQRWYDIYGRIRYRSREVKEPTAEFTPTEPPAEVLARIEIPQTAVDFISQLIVPGSSLIVSDHSLGDETGEGTNFIVVTR